MTGEPVDDPLSTVKRYIAALNNADESGMDACFAPEGSILEMMPDPAALSSVTTDWYQSILAAAKHAGADSYSVTLAEPLRQVISGDVAYLVVPSKVHFELKERKTKQAGALFIFVLLKVEGIWRICPQEAGQEIRKSQTRLPRL